MQPPSHSRILRGPSTSPWGETAGPRNGARLPCDDGHQQVQPAGRAIHTPTTTQVPPECHRGTRKPTKKQHLLTTPLWTRNIRPKKWCAVSMRAWYQQVQPVGELPLGMPGNTQVPPACHQTPTVLRVQPWPTVPCTYIHRQGAKTGMGATHRSLTLRTAKVKKTTSRPRLAMPFTCGCCPCLTVS